MNKKMQRIIVAIIAIILAITMILTLIAPVLASDEGSTASGGLDISCTSDTILQGVHIGSVDVSGMTADQARSAVQAQVDGMAASTLTVDANGKTDTAPVSDLGFSWTNTDVADKAAKLGKCGNLLARYKFAKDAENEGYGLPIERSYDENAVQNFISRAASAVDVKAVECGLATDADGNITVTDGQNGMEVDEYESLSAVMVYLNTGWESGAPSVSLVTKVTEPKTNKEELDKVRDVLGSGSTIYAGSKAERCKNIENGVSLINGTLLLPGEQFSLLAHVTPFSAEHGYALAPSYAEGSVVDTYGGGICQVSTTLYLAVLQAELQVDQRTCHSMMVGYIEPSMDAAISEEGGKDLVFTNNTASPVYIMGKTEGGKIYFSIYGAETRPAGRTVAYRSVTLSTTEADFKLSADENTPFGVVTQTSSGHLGMEAQLWKDVTENGTTVSTQVNDSSYQMSPVSYILGVQTDNAQAKSELEGQIAENELEKSYEVIAKYGVTVVNKSTE